MIRVYLFNITCSLLFIASSAFGQDTRLTKSIEKDFDVPPGASLELKNKYGDIVVNTWDEPSIRIKITLTAYGKDDNATKKLMDRVEFDFHQANDFLTVESVFDRRSGFFKDLINSVSDYSKSLLSKNKLNVSYDVTLPENAASVSIENRYGDIYFQKFDARVTIVQAHGNLKADSFKGYSILDLSYGDAKIKELGDCRLTLKGVNFESRSIGELNLESSSSTLILGGVNVLKGKSTNDKIRMEESSLVTFDADFSQIEIEHLTGSCRLDQSYGELDIALVGEACNDLKLYGKSTDYNLHISSRLAFKAEILAREDRLSLGAFGIQFEKEYLDEKAKIVRITGIKGNQSDAANIFIDGKNGEVFIDLASRMAQDYNK